MSDDDILLGKADQLMRRHRSFVASAKSSNGVTEEGEDLDQDLPLLTDVVSADQAAPVGDASRLRLEQLLAQQRAAMLSEFERWLDEQLPQVVTSAMDGITDRLLGLIMRRAKAELLPRLEAVAARTGEHSQQILGEDGAAREGDQRL